MSTSDTMVEYRIDEEIVTGIGNRRTTGPGCIRLRETSPTGETTGVGGISHVSVAMKDMDGELMIGVLDAETILEMAERIEDSGTKPAQQH